MTITRANAEAILVSRAGKKMALVGLDQTILGSNPDLNDPIATALIRMGISVLDISHVADADMAQLPVENVTEFLDRAELRLLESVLGNYTLTDISLGGRNESFSQIATSLEKAVEAKLKHISMTYASYLEAGSYIADQQARMDDE